ncbi:ABC transporter permease [Geothermobacter hydrogeniphilus]|uniref:ABC transmembrane type-1 domain-containing protein n=1 Tax=Geothermobacter hydrogeniphilus TaxID=1969733 RepID=A0A1X0Y2F6_9BACT|nr:ABC transporter permease [Geothermobacter hydrogeniphilus]ORJ59340.1 hypothetical protein B5V00_10630 [Geothermobacter hydrogeniphilus]
MTPHHNRIFLAALILPMGLLAGYFLLLLGGQAPYLSWAALRAELSSPSLLDAIRLSLVSATIATLAALAFAVPVGYALARLSFPGKRLLDTLLDLPVVLTPVALGTLILMALNTPPGRFLHSLGLTLPFTVAGVIAAQFTVVVAMAVRMLKASFEEISPRYEQVARLLGCSAGGSFLRVTLPLARRGILAAFILCWARAIGEFGATVMVAGTARGQTATLPSSIYLAMSAADLSRAVVLILILILISFAVLFLVRLVGGRRP